MLLMLRKLMLLMGAVLVALALVVPGPAQAQDGPHAWTDVETNLRVGPSTSRDLITTLPTNTAVTIEGRTRNTSWILVRTAEGVRGWGYTRLFRIADGVKLNAFAISDELLTVSAPPSSGSGEPPSPGVSGTAPLNAPNVSVGSVAAMRAVAAKGRQLGNNRRVFAKVGDCMSAHWAFLSPLGWGQTNLDQYGYLSDVIAHFNTAPRDGVGSSWDERSYAAHDGFNSAAVLDPIWSDKAVCELEENALDCQYRLTKPAVAVIMFGTADVLVMSAAQFNKYMRDVVKHTLDRGIVPILTTFPENAAVQERSRQINQVVLKIAREKGLPLINLADAVRNLPGGGIDGTGLYLTIPPGNGTGDFSADGLNYGYNMRNLLTAQALDQVWRKILN